MTLTVMLSEQLPSGKNQVRHAFVKGRRIRYPNKRFETWRAQAETEILLQRQTWPATLRHRLPLSRPMIMAVSYREIIPVPARGTRDLTGMQDAIQHLLERCELIQSDGLIHGMIWSFPWRQDGPGAMVTLIETCPEINGSVFDQCIQLLRVQTRTYDDALLTHAERIVPHAD